MNIRTLCLSAAIVLCGALAALAQSNNLLLLGVGGPTASASFPLDAIGQANTERVYSTCRMFTAYNSNLIAVTTIGGATTNYTGSSGGCVPWATIATQCTTATSCSVTFFDQSGNAANTAQGAACSLISNCVLIDATNKWINCNNPTALGNYLTFTDSTQSQPFAYVVNYNNHAFLNNNQMYSTNGGLGLQYSGSTALTLNFNNSTYSLTVTNNTWNALAAIANSTSSSLAINNGSASTGNSGATGTAAGTAAICTNTGSAGYYSADMYLDTFVEFKGNPSSGNLSTFITWIRANMHT